MCNETRHVKGLSCTLKDSCVNMERTLGNRTTLWAAQRQWWIAKHYEDLLAYHIISSFSSSLSTAERSLFQSKSQSSFSNPKKNKKNFYLPTPQPHPPSDFRQTVLISPLTCWHHLSYISLFISYSYYLFTLSQWCTNLGYLTLPNHLSSWPYRLIPSSVYCSQPPSFP